LHFPLNLQLAAVPPNLVFSQSLASLDPGHSPNYKSNEFNSLIPPILPPEHRLNTTHPLRKASIPLVSLHG
jgi:hypothetical protein